MRQTAEFLGVSYNAEEERQLLDHLSFESMKNNPMVNFQNDIKEMGKENMTFIRKGKVESWKEEMTNEMSQRFDSWTREKLIGSDFPSYLNKNEL